MLPLLDDAQAGLRSYLIRLSRRESAAPGFAHKGVELVAVAAGLVQVVLPTGRPVLRPGESLLADQSGVLSWRNVGEGDAMLFWILRDDRRQSRSPLGRRTPLNFEGGVAAVSRDTVLRRGALAARTVELQRSAALAASAFGHSCRGAGTGPGQ